ncbi:hypothetical protein CYMTET_10616 [Cymbomonas tetramitiformis]|uniref:Uncharacterized protein n=1 Tax=Cymbomonas tetramitiformis TaxID=36881 RepID=A0AAE0LDU3_9CHLO|nr:hypothetical protein CYMTET_10616 [Cymbomonas tetramitiformis]
MQSSTSAMRSFSGEDTYENGHNNAAPVHVDMTLNPLHPAPSEQHASFSQHAHRVLKKGGQRVGVTPPPHGCDAEIHALPNEDMDREHCGEQSRQARNGATEDVESDGRLSMAMSADFDDNGVDLHRWLESARSHNEQCDPHSATD